MEINCMKKATTKSERKYGKKESTSEVKQEDEDMYKILIDGSAFTYAMTHSKCVQFMNKKKAKSKFLNQEPPSMILVKQ